MMRLGLEAPTADAVAAKRARTNSGGDSRTTSVRGTGSDDTKYHALVKTMAKLQLMHSQEIRQLRAATQHTMTLASDGLIMTQMQLEKENYIAATKGKKGHGLPPLDVFLWRGFVTALLSSIQDPSAASQAEHHQTIKQHIDTCETTTLARHVRNCFYKKMFEKTKMKFVCAFSPAFEGTGLAIIEIAEKMGHAVYLTGTDAAGGLERDVEKLLQNKTS